jgi:RNase P subunit RPR2
MEPRIFHGSLTPETLARALTAEFNQGPYRAQQIGDDQRIMVQIATREYARSGGQTAMTVSLQSVPDGVAVSLGKQSWMDVAASLGKTAFWAWRNPWTLIDRLDDLAQDVENLQLSERVWVTIENAARASGASFELSERLRRLVCRYCNTANPIGEPSCVACGAPLGDAQPRTCLNCGFVIRTDEAICPNCGKRL